MANDRSPFREDPKKNGQTPASAPSGARPGGDPGHSLPRRPGRPGTASADPAASGRRWCRRRWPARPGWWTCAGRNSGWRSAPVPGPRNCNSSSRNSWRPWTGSWDPARSKTSGCGWVGGRHSLGAQLCVRHLEGGTHRSAPTKDVVLVGPHFDIRWIFLLLPNYFTRLSFQPASVRVVRLWSMPG